MKKKKRRIVKSKDKEYYLTYKSSGFTDIIKAKSEKDAEDYFLKHSGKITKYPTQLTVDSIYLVGEKKAFFKRKNGKHKKIKL